MNRVRFVVALLVLMAVGPLHAEVRLPALFSKHAVLQKSDRVAIWGSADPGEQVAVSLGDAAVVGKAGADGRWLVWLDLSRSGAGPFELVVRGTNTLTIPDVLVGEVWLASGQSNMEWTVRDSTDSKQVVAASANPRLRHFRVAKLAGAEPASEVQGEWLVADPKTTGRFTAIGYFFAHALERALDTPVGIVNASWGGTPIEAWTSPEALGRDAELHATTRQRHDYALGFPARLTEHAEKFAGWAARHDRGDVAQARPADMTGVATSGVSWSSITLPADAAAGLPPAGAVWLRRTFTIAPEHAGLQQPLEIGRIDGFYQVYFNGEKVAEVGPSTGARPERPIYINAPLVRAGEGVLAIRIFNPVGVPTIRAGAPLRFMRQTLEGEWRGWVERALPAADETARAEYGAPPEQPWQERFIGGWLYNGMIAPLVPLSFRGALWYQGESNTGRSWQYRTAFPLLIDGWRERWGRGDFPFYFCQLANMGGKVSAPGDHAWAELREAQSLALGLPRTGQVVLIDVGEDDDVHWRHKRVAGERLARIALADTYGRNVVFSGPVYRSHAVEGGKIRLSFDHVGGGLAARPLPESYRPRSTAERTVPLVRNSPGSELEGFAICGADRKWRWAQAKIEGSTVLVWSPEVPRPVAVRHGWAMNPTCNLVNAEGLPAGPFRTDDFPAITRNDRY